MQVGLLSEDMQHKAQQHQALPQQSPGQAQQRDHQAAVLLQDLRPNELAVFFRNNHFNAVLMYNNAIHILVTDQGYEFERVRAGSISLA